MGLRNTAKTAVSKKRAAEQAVADRAIRRKVHRQWLRLQRKREERAYQKEIARQNWRPEKRDRSVRVVRERVEWTVESARTTFVDTCLMMRSRAMGGLKKWKIDEDMLAVFAEMFGYSGTKPNDLASNMNARMAAGRSWIQDAVKMQQRHPGWHFYMVTLIDDRIRTAEYETRIDLSKFVKDVRNLLGYAGIRDFLAAVEFQPYAKGHRGRGRDIGPHTHVCIWLPEPLSAEARARLEGSRRFSSLTDAPTVVVTERASDPGQIAHWAQYIFKAPERAANLVSRRDGSGGFVSRDTFLRPIFAIRIMEVLSQVSLSSLIYAGGTGRRYRDRIVNAINKHAVYRGQPMTPASAGAAWAHARSVAGKTNRKPVEFGPASSSDE